MSLSPGVIKHEMVFHSQSGEEYVTDAESFSNSYNVFTLISQPVRRHAQLVVSIVMPECGPCRGE